MGLFDNQIMALFSLDIFKQVYCNENVNLLKLNAFIRILVSYNIPFDLSYTNGTRRDAATAELTIYITPSVNLVINIALEPGADINQNSNN